MKGLSFRVDSPDLSCEQEGGRDVAWLEGVVTGVLGREPLSRTFSGLRAALSPPTSHSLFDRIAAAASDRRWTIDSCPSSHMSRGTVLWILAHMALLNIKPGPAAADVSLARLYQSTDPVGIERLKAFFSYFLLVDQLDLNEIVSVRRIRADSDAWWRGDDVCDWEHVVVHGEMMEKPDDGRAAFVDFANSLIHIGSIIESATQEEVLFSSCPELFSWLPFLEPIQPDEVIIVEGALRLCSYKGYGADYTFTGPCPKPWIPQEILVMDASMVKHFKSSQRDLLKAHLAFSNANQSSISTGAWGCGVFGGNIFAKFVQQVMMCPSTKKLYFSMYGRPRDDVEKIGVLLQKLKVCRPTNAWLLNVMIEYADATGAEEDDAFSAYSSRMKGHGDGFLNYLLEQLALTNLAG